MRSHTQRLARRLITIGDGAPSRSLLVALAQHALILRLFVCRENIGPSAPVAAKSGMHIRHRSATVAHRVETVGMAYSMRRSRYTSCRILPLTLRRLTCRIES